MHIYGGQNFHSHPVYGWNSVDVLTESGLFQHGEIIDVAENGLIVDFQCSEQRSQCVSYGKIFSAAIAPCSAGYLSWHDEVQMSPAVTENASVQVLWRAHPGAPWLWYPGLLLSQAFCFPYFIDLLIVQVQHDDCQSAELFPVEQVRFPPSKKALAKRALRPNTFVVRECRLPENNWLTGVDDRRARQLKAWWSVRVVSVRNAVAKLLQPSDARQPTQANLVRQAAEQDVVLENDSSRADDQQDDADMPSRKKRKHHADDGQPETGPRIPTQPHLLREIFQSLDSVRRLQLCRVCPLWNTVLTGADGSHTVRVSFDMDPGVIYGAVGSLLKCLNNSTQRLIVQDVGGGDAGVVMTVMGRMLRTLHIRAIIFHKVSFDWDDTDEFPVGEEIVPQENQPEDRVTLKRGIACLAAVLKAWAGFCEELRLCRCKFRCDDLMEAAIPQATIKLDAADIAEQIWDLYEAHLSREGLNLEYLAEGIRTGPDVLRRMVTELLENYQSADPRLTAHYRGKQWTVESLKDLDFAKLTTITLRALAEALPVAGEDGDEQNSEEVDDSEEDEE